MALSKRTSLVWLLELSVICKNPSDLPVRYAVSVVLSQYDSAEEFAGRLVAAVAAVKHADPRGSHRESATLLPENVSLTSVDPVVGNACAMSVDEAATMPRLSNKLTTNAYPPPRRRIRTAAAFRMSGIP
jgi:hypothetical protein